MNGFPRKISSFKDSRDSDSIYGLQQGQKPRGSIATVQSGNLILTLILLLTLCVALHRLLALSGHQHQFFSPMQLEDQLYVNFF